MAAIETVREASAPAGGSAWPVYLTRFVGRAGELEELAGWLERGDRLLTLCGAGGSGKTRLAVELAERRAARFPGGVVWVPLVGVEDGPGVAAAVAAAVLGRPFPGAHSVRAAARAIGRRPALVVLDNAEHVAAACAAAARELAGSCPAVVVLLTSRVPLGVAGERVYAVPPLGGRPAGGAMSDAQALFVDRAAIGAPGWSVASATQEVVGQICARLDHHPLAIELAASWVRVLSPQDLLAELSRNLSMLAAVGEAVENRHRSLSAVLQSSWAWLGTAERDVLAAVGTFVGGFSLEAAREVAGASLSVLAGLSERALIRRVPQPSGETRYHLHELVREFALGQLRAAGAARWAEVEDRHYRHYAGVVRAAGEALDTAAEAAALERVRADQGNVDAALARAIDRGAATEALRLAGDLFSYWTYTSPLPTKRPLLERVLALPGPADADPAVRARVLDLAGYAWVRHDPVTARRLFDEAAACYRQIQDRAGEARSLRGIAHCYLQAGEAERGQQVVATSLLISREIGDRTGLAWALFDQGELAYARHDLDAAEARLREGLAALTEQDIGFGVYRALLLVAEVHRLRGRWSEALTGYRRTLDHQRRRRFTARGPDLLEGVAALATDVGRADLAAGLFGAATSWLEVNGSCRQRHRQTDYERAYGRARRQLDDADWAERFGRGQELSTEEAELCVERCILELLVWCRGDARPQLTPREVDALRLVGEGLTSAEIATRLVLSPRTVHAHLRSIFTKLDVTTRTAAAMKAVELGLIPPQS